MLMKKFQNSLKRGSHRTSCLCAAAVSALLFAGNVYGAPAQSPGPAPAEASSQTVKVKVSGTVLDGANDEPLAYATISEKGNPSNGVAADADGNFTISVPANATLLVSYVGYDEKSVSVNGKKNLEIVLSPAAGNLDEVVVVGYAAQKKVNLTGAVASIDFKDKEASRPMTTISAALSGAVAGLNVMTTGGKPNSEGATVAIRGYGTLNNSDPLILVDGMEMGLNEVNPNDVASISVLKDAASCAIYGNRGANGVILITTKRGSEGRINVTYSGKFTLNTPQKIIRQVTDYADYMEMINEGYHGSGQAEKFSLSTITEWREAAKNPNALNEYGYPNYVSHPNTDWYDALYKKQWMQEHTITLTGQDRRTEYMLSGTYLHNPGIIEAAGLNKYYLRSEILSHVTKFLAVGMRAWGYHNDQRRDDVDTMWAINMQKMTPGVYPEYNGLYGGIETTEEDGATGNVVMGLAGEHGYYKQTKWYVNPYIELDLPYGFRFISNFYYDDFRNHHKWNPSPFLQQVSFRRGVPLNFERTEANLKDECVYDWDAYDNSWKTSNILYFNHEYGKHEVSALVGYEEFRKWGGTRDLCKSGMTDINLTDFDTMTNPKYIYGSNWEYSSRSWFGRANYAYDNRYLFEVNMRYDGSSRFAKKNRWGFFPSFSAGWRIGQEKFIDKPDWFNDLKLRVSWGKLGNNSIGNYEWQALYQSANASFGDKITNGLGMYKFANADLSWEETKVTNVGIDYNFLNNRLWGTIDFYNKQTSGILYRPTLSSMLQYFTSPLQNLAEVNNKGLEFSVTWNDRAGDFNYSVSANFSWNRNRVTKYKGELKESWGTDENGNPIWKTNIGEVSTGGNTRVLEGHEMNEFYMLNRYHGTGQGFNADGSVNINGGPKDGMIRTEGDMAWLKAMMAKGYRFFPTQRVDKNAIWYGDYIYADENGDGKYGDDQDRKFQGCSSMPKFYFGLQGSVQWKGIDLSMVWSGAAGFKIEYYQNTQNSTSIIHGYGIGKEVGYDHYYYDPENPNDPRTNTTSVNPRFTAGADNGQQKANSEFHLHNGNYLKLKNLTLGYTLPKKWTSKVFMQSVRVYTSMENLCTITKFKGIDPEMRAGDGYAPMRSYAFGLTVTF